MTMLSRLLGLFGHRELDAWRDRHVEIASKSMNEVAADYLECMDPAIDALGWEELSSGSGTFLARRVSPALERLGDDAARRLVADANAALAEIVAHRAVWARQANPAPDEPGTFATMVGTAAVASGLVSADRMADRARERLRRDVRNHVIARLVEGGERRPSIREQLTALIETTARQARAIR